MNKNNSRSKSFSLECPSSLKCLNPAKIQILIEPPDQSDSLSKSKLKRNSISSLKPNSTFRRYSLAVQSCRNSFYGQNCNNKKSKKLISKEDEKTSEKHLLNKFTEINKKPMNLTSLLTKTGQCAMLKTYEDQIYNQLRHLSSKNSNLKLPRISTAKFNSNSTNNKQALYLFQNCDTEDKVNEQINSAMKILDLLSDYKINEYEYKNKNYLAPLNPNSKLNEAIKNYEKWQKNWEYMLENEF